MATPSRVNFENDGFIAALDGLTGEPLWGITAAVSEFAGEVCYLSASASGQLAITGRVYGSIARFGSVVVRYPNTNPADPKAYVAKLISHYNQFQGAVYADTNADSVLSPGDRVFPEVVVQTTPDNFLFTTADDGTYGAVVELGTHAVSLPKVPLYHTLPNPPAPASFTTFGNVAAGRDFVLQPVPGQQDVQVFLTPVTEAMPGVPLTYQVLYRNIGTTTPSGSLTLTYDSRLTYVSNTGGATANGRTLTVAYPALAPGESHTFDVLFNVLASVADGTVLTTTATAGPVATDLTPADNTETSRLTVTGSADPFSMRVNWPRLDPAQVAAGEWLDYVVRFRNVGTDTVFSVMLRDSLPGAQLNLATLQLLTASHPCTWRLASGGQLIATFTNIRLPNSTTNARGAAGFARFRVQPASTLVLGDVVANQARLHFDARPAVLTIPALTEVQVITGRATEGADANLSVWPNPTAGLLNVALTRRAAQAGPLTLTLLDGLGRPVLRHAAANTGSAALDVRHLPAGLYLLRGEQPGQSFTRRVVLR